MSRYKLIKTYPFSPELGTIANVESDEHIKNYPEFWQPEENWVNKEDITNLAYEFHKSNVFDFHELAAIAERYFRLKYKLYERTI